MFSLLAFIFEHLYKTRQEADVLIFYGMQSAASVREGLIKNFSLDGEETHCINLQRKNVMSGRV